LEVYAGSDAGEPSGPIGDPHVEEIEALTEANRRDFAADEAPTELRAEPPVDLPETPPLAIEPEAPAQPVAAEPPPPPPAPPVEDNRPKRSGWWSRKSSFF
jgi:ribonuclease E